MRRTMKHGLRAACLLAWAVQAHAQPLPLAEEPLFISPSTEPNILLFVDDSNYMMNIAPVEDAVPDLTVCPAANEIPPGSEVELRIDFGDLAPKIRFGTGEFDLGDGDPGDERCFAPAEFYLARLNADKPTGRPSGYPHARYTGAFLNWYFDPANTTPVWQIQSHKPGTQTLLEVAQSAASGLVDILDDVRLGVASFNDDDGALLREEVGDLNAGAKRADVAAAIAGLTPDDRRDSPIAEALRDIGRYYVGKNRNPTLLIHPDEVGEASVSADSLLGNGPEPSGLGNDSPIELFCQPSHTVLVTAGLSQRDRVIAPELRDYDGDCADPAACLVDDQKPGRLYGNDGSDHVDDVAQALHEIDLRPDLSENNRLTTHVVRVGDDPLLADLLSETAAQGGGLMVDAGDLDMLGPEFSKAAGFTGDQIGAGGSVAFNQTLLTDGSVLFAARFHTRRWSGELRAVEIVTDPVLGIVADIDNPLWDAASRLDGTVPGDRVILTSDDSGDGIAFDTFSDLSAAQQADLNTGPGGTPDGLGPERLEFLRGDRSREGAEFRERDSVLGDIVHSSPVFVGAPELDWPDSEEFGADGNRYSNFKSDQTGRDPVVYIGANDGMLHGFDAATGDEVVAYVPRFLSSTAADRGLHFLTDPAYEHRYYVDLTPTVSDVFLDAGDGNGNAWHTVLIGGARGGGRGLFALEITDPDFGARDAADVVWWEFTSADDADLGFTFSQPTVVLMPNGRWAAVFGNGYNNDGSGKAALFIVFLDGGLDGTWTPDVDYRKIVVGDGSVEAPNGLSTPIVADLDGDRIADRVYAGDLQGNLWAFDVHFQDPDQWSAAYGADPLFRARNAAGEPQPITARPFLSRHPSQTDAGNEPNVIVLFGTGRYLIDDDKRSEAIQSFYGVWDHGVGGLTRDDLIEQDPNDPAINDDPDFRVPTDRAVDYTTDDGWFMDFLEATETEAAERVVTGARVRDDVVFFNTWIPNKAPCGTGGSGFLMSLRVETGGRPLAPAFEVNSDGVVTIQDVIGKAGVEKVPPGGTRFDQGMPGESGFHGTQRFSMGSGGGLGRDVVRALAGTRTGRLYWKELRKD